MDFTTLYELSQRWISLYHAIPGKRVRITQKDGTGVPEVFWLLAQEEQYLVLAQEPLQPGATKRRCTVLSTTDITDFKELETADPLAPSIVSGATDGAEITFEHAGILFSPGRLSLHALTPSGSRHWLELTGLEPGFGGYFQGPNHLLAFALQHLHFDMQDAGLVAGGDLPLHPRPWTLPAAGIPAQLPIGETPAATLTILVHETVSDQLTAATFTPIHEGAAGPRLGSRHLVLAWGYELLCQEAVRRRILPGDFRPRIKRVGLR